MRVNTRNIGCLLLLLLATFATAQEQARLSERELTGTARYVGMGGAMTAVGGDPSAVRDNPAGLGVYRRMEMLVSMGGKWDYTAASNGRWNAPYARFEMPQASWVFDFGDPYKSRGVIFNNLMISYNRVRQYQREYAVSVSNAEASLADVIALKTNGLPEANLQPAERWSDHEIGWLSILGYDTWLINPQNDPENRWYTNLSEGERVNSAANVRESGYMDEYALDWGMNISNRWFVGAGIRCTSFYFSQEENYAEESASGVQIHNYSSVLMSGLGVNAAFGMIGHPVQWLRFGVALTTPTASTLSVANYGKMTARVDSVRTATTLDPEFVPYGNFSMPMRMSASLAFQLRHYGILAFQYDYAHHKYLADVHTLEVGLEVVPVPRLFINAGYVYESTFTDRNRVHYYDRAYNDMRTDTHAIYTRNTQYISCGIGYRGRSLILQAAYQYQLQTTDFQLHELTSAGDIDSRTHRLVVTLGWHGIQQ